MKKAQNERLLAGPLEKLAELQPILLAIGPDTRLTKLLAAIAGAANDVLGGHFCVVFPYDQDSDTFIMDQVTAAGAPEALDFQWTVPRPDGTVQTALRQGVFIARDYQKDVERYPFLAEGPGAFRGVADIKACLGLCLEAGGEKVGVLFVNYPEPHPFSEEETRIAELFASQAALAIRNVRLYERNVSTLSDLRGLIDITQSLSALHRDADPREILQNIVEAANEVLAASASVIFSYDEESDRFLMDQLVAAGEGTATFDWQQPRKEGATRKVLDLETPFAMNLEDAPGEWASLLGSGAFKDHFQFQASAGAPLRVGTEKVGVLYINYRARHSFDEQERNLIQAFANTAAVILHNARLYEQIRRRAETLENLFEITREVTSVIADPSLTLQTIIERAVRLIGTMRGAILLYQNGFGTVEAGHHLNPAVPVGVGVSFATDTPLQLRIKENRQPVQIEDVAAAPFLSDDERKQFQERGIKSLLIVPLVVKNKAIGSIGLDETRRTRVFTVEEVKLCQILAGQAAVAIENARLYEQRTRDIAALQEINAAITSESLEKISGMIAQKARELTEADYSGLWIVDGDRLVLGAMYGMELMKAPELSIDGTSINGWVAHTGKQYACFDVRDDPHYRMWQEEVQSSVAVPLISGQRVVGTLSVESARPRAFSDYQLNLLQSLGDQAAIAIENAWIYEQRSRDIAALQAINEAVVSEERQKVLDLVVGKAVEVMPGEYAELWLLEPATGDLVLQAVSGPGEAAAHEIERLRAAEASINVRVAQAGTPYISDNVAGERDFYRIYEAAQSSVTVPLKYRDKVVGTINVESSQLKAFTKQHSRLLDSFADQAASAINLQEEFKRTKEVTELGNTLAMLEQGF